MGNNCNFIGNLTRDPEGRNTSNGKFVCNFTIAVKKRFKRDEAIFIRVNAWGKNGENCMQYLSKGKKVFVSGELDVRQYESNGKNGTSVELSANEVEFLTPKDTNTPTQQQNRTQGNYNNQNQQGNNDFQDLNDNEDIVPF